MKSKMYNSSSGLAKDFGLPVERGLVAEMKAKLTKEIVKAISKRGLTHKEVSELSGVPRSAVTGIINGSLQKVTLDRLIRILGTLGKTIELKIKTAA
ncbi:MAG: XRE family transcriptional regulator [Halobacteriovoraceae bacterium]|nr:XRE family transcriptional regulator [Halobacteriovoraceae bacterium]